MSNEKLTSYRGMTGRGSKKALPIEDGDMTAIMDITIESCKKRLGRPANYPADEKGLSDFVARTIDFFEYVRTVNEDRETKQKLIPDVELWSMYLGITRQSLWNYHQRGGKWAEVISYFKDSILAVKKQMAMHFQIPPAFAIFDLVNSHGYADVKQFHLSTPETEIRPNDALESKIKAAGLIWDAESNEFIEDKGNI